uniref:Uncharacterized protein n=1 Tax=Populus davidiana TaxID=266767 RepID=A0A6M2EP02_9ROSI
MGTFSIFTGYCSYSSTRERKESLVILILCCLTGKPPDVSKWPFISHEVGLISPPRTEDDGRMVSRFPNNKSRRLRVVYCFMATLFVSNPSCTSYAFLSLKQKQFMRFKQERRRS